MSLGDRIRKAREAARLTQAGLAKSFGVSRNAISLWESNTNSPTADKIGEIARLTRVRVEWLWAAEGPQTIDPNSKAEAVLVGYIGAGEKVYRNVDGRNDVLEGGIIPPAGYTNAVAARIRGRSMLPLEPGWLVFYEHEFQGDPLLHLNKLCAVGLDDDATYIKKLTRKGSKFVLKSWNPEAEDIQDAKVVWASPIIEIRPK